MAPPRLLVIDDDAETCRFMQEVLATGGREVEAAQDPHEALALLDGPPFDVVVSDIHLNARLSGLDLLRAVKARDPRVEVVLLSGFGTLETAVAAVRAGAFDYVSKPIDVARVREVVAAALARRARGETPPVATLPADDPSPDGLVGRSAGMLAVYVRIAMASASDAPVLVTGETGTGKELVARALHRHGPRQGAAFVAVNCGSFAEGVLESELFGHVRGAFTGAAADKRGVFEQAHQGTLFLDEVGELPPSAQVRLLRALESGEIRPVGSERPRRVDVRVVAATHRDLERAVREGTFRQDLFYRLDVFRVALPPLRERREDIPLLAAHLLRAARGRDGGPVALSPGALDALVAWPWPGNVRELRNTLERLAAGASGGVVDVSDLPPEWRQPAPAAGGDALFAGLPSLDEMERRYLVHVLAATGGNRSRAAEVLGIDRRTLYRMAARLGVELPAGEG
jgi:DNA-binding NtrC family response regulator